MTGPITIRDPLWDTIRVDGVARVLIDSPAFQRLRYIRQLGHAHLVYPGATHTRFDHAVGVHHLARRALAVLGERGNLSQVDPVDCAVLPLAALLHDLGHYPFSHALEELDAASIPGDHESLVVRFLDLPELGDVLHGVAPDAAERIDALVRGTSSSPLQGLVSGSLDLDKIEYLARDARFCGVPYGEVDVDRLLHALLLVRDPATDRLELGVHEKGVAALESLLFAKYQMYRNVYWHHAVRAATVLYKRLVADALQDGLITAEDLVGATDEGLMHRLSDRAGAAATEVARRVAGGVDALRVRRLPKRAAEVSAGDLVDPARADWMGRDSTLKRAVEEQLAAELGAAPGTVFIDFPSKPLMFALDLLLHRRSGEVIRLGPAGREGLIGLPQIAEQLYRSARMLRLYVWGERIDVPAAALAGLARLDEAGAAAALAAGERLLRR